VRPQYHPSRGSAPSPGSASIVFLMFLDEFESNHHSSGLKTDAGLGKWCGEVGTTLGAEVSTWSMKS